MVLPLALLRHHHNSPIWSRPGDGLLTHLLTHLVSHRKGQAPRAAPAPGPELPGWLRGCPFVCERCPAAPYGRHRRSRLDCY